MLVVAVLAMNFLVPFVALFSRAARENRRILLASALLVVLGMWLERFLLVVPSLTPVARISFGWSEVLISAGFFGSFALTYLTALRTLPILAKTVSFWR